jgi:hypothetical protein
VFFLFVFFIAFLVTSSLKADYTLNFNTGDLYYLKRIMYRSESDNCTLSMKQEAIEAFIRYGHKSGFNNKTQFGKGYKVNKKDACLEIAFDPTLFNYSPDIPLTIHISSRKGFFSLSPDLHFTVSPEMNDLVKKLIKENINQDRP